MRPAIVEAAQAESVWRAALAYSLLGISVIPCQGKKPATTEGGFEYPWRANMQRRANQYTIAQWRDRGYLQNLGIVCGAISGNLVVIDLDGLDAVEAFSKTFPHLMNTYTVGSGSGKGLHLYYRTKSLMATTRVVGAPCGNVELRSNGCYVIAPPSIHPTSNRPYEVARELHVRTVDTLGTVQDWIKSMIAEKHGGNLPQSKPKPVVVTSANRYALAALRSESAKVRGAQVGARNTTLNTAAFKLARFVREGLLTRSEVEDELFFAARALVMEDGEMAVLKSIKCGLDTGIAKAGK